MGGRHSARSVEAQGRRASDPLIWPAFETISNELRSGKRTLDDDARDHPEQWSAAVVPAELLPFLETRTVAALKKTLLEHPWLYSHPLVQSEVRYLHRLRWDDALWDDLGWVVPLGSWAPSETAQVTSVLQDLIALYAGGLLPDFRVHWRATPSRPGPKAVIKNPQPAALPLDDSIDATTLTESFEGLRGILSRDLREIAPLKLGGAISPATRKRVCRIALQALRESRIDWSGGRRVVFRRLNDDVEIVLPSGEILGGWLQAGYQWKVPSLLHTVDRLFDDLVERRRIERAGLPSALACVILAALLNVAPARIRSVIEGHRRARRRARPPRGGASSE